MYEISKFLFMKKILNGVPQYSSMNFDFIGINKKTGKPIIIEYLKRGENQVDYITPMTSHMNRYIRQNKGKFKAFDIAQRVLGAEIYYINYAMENTIVKDRNGNEIDLGEQIKVMKQENIVFGRDTIKNGKTVADDIHFKTIKRFYSFKAFDKWLHSFCLKNCEEFPFSFNEVNSTLISKDEAISFIKGKNSEYLKQQEKSKQGLSYRRELIMPDLSGDIFEDRLSFDISLYKMKITRQFFIQSTRRFVFLSEVETDKNPHDYNFDYSSLKKETDFLNLHFRLIIVFNPNSENIKYFKISKNGISSENISVFDFQNKIKELSNLSNLK